MKIGSLSFAPLWLLLAATASFRPVESALTVEYMSANNQNFTCTVLRHESKDPNAPRKDIMLLHGFPMFRVWWTPLLEYWDTMLTTDDDTSVRAVACDLRGYSPGASPDDINQYSYDIFTEDTFALATAAGFDDGFHLVGHDHGAALSWYVATHDVESQLHSLTTLSVPHLDLLSDALCGDNTDEDQVIASNYFNQFSLPDSATINNASLTGVFASFGLSNEPDQFQKMLWWYHGSLASSFSRPRVISDAELLAYQSSNGEEAGFLVGLVRQAIPMEERPCVSNEDYIGGVDIPTLFICGVDDSSLLCNKDYVRDYPDDLLPNYEHANFQCGHDFFLPDNCVNMDESRAVMEKITSFVLSAEKPMQTQTQRPTAEPAEPAEPSTPSDEASGTKTSAMIMAGMLSGALIELAF